MEAENLLVGFAEENGGRVLINNLGSSDTSFIPQGLVHFEMNMGCKPAFYLSTYNNVDPGLVTLSDRVFEFPLEILESTYYLTKEQIKLMKRYLPNTPTAGVMNYGFDECIERCDRREKYEAKSYKSNKYQDSYKTESYEIKKTRQYPDVEKPSYVEDAYEEEFNEYEAMQYKPDKYEDLHKSYKTGSYETKKLKQYPEAKDLYEKESYTLETKPYKSKKYQESYVAKSYNTGKTRQHPMLVKPIESSYVEDSYEPEFYVTETTTKQSPVYTTKAAYTASTPYKPSY